MAIKDKAGEAKKASIHLAAVPTNIKNNALKAIARALEEKSDQIISANQMDLENAAKDDLAEPLLKRLKFQQDKIKDAIEGINSVIGLEDPVGVTSSALELDKGLELFKVSSPIGVIGIVFESRPDALVQISSLCLKSGNAVMMKGGSEAANTNRILADIISKAGIEAGIPEDWLTLMEARSDVADMLSMDKFIDLIIPRGSNEFVKYIMDNTNIPVLGHADGICHVYIDKLVDIEMAVNIAVDSKCQYVAVCNAAETLLVHKDIAPKVLPELKTALEKKGVEIRGCENTLKIIDVKATTEEDWRTEYLDLIVSVRIVDKLDDAINHINTFGSGHTDVIVTEDKNRGIKFMDYVDSADVFLNCSSRFADGFRYGLGAEVGISTNKIHARGPVGLEGLMIYKWRLVGNGHVVSDYSGTNAKTFTHRPLDKKFNK
ncbi:MAG: glutamate-5-semialdehyde dehydrogenase [Desulfobacteraceae bacterium]|nr:glutamate-5-semialdehyde dehydrogenase [Desulfobacteraceae bacterium]MBC2757550.1 glutamate-5-semialdehyde dehydrogenase [Desulfobacteraceae bacterium]